MEETVSNPQAAVSESKLVFKHFPHYAKHIKENYIIPYIKEQLVLARQVKLPLMDHFRSMPEDELVQISIPSHTEFLTAVEENKLDELIDVSTKRWINDELEIISRYDVKAEDLTLGSYIRKRALSKFIFSYTTDPSEIIELLGEIDTYSSQSDTASANAYITILQDKIQDQLHTQKKISEQLAEREAQLLEAQEQADMASYEWNVENDEISATPNFLKIFDVKEGFKLADFQQNIHPEDRDAINKSLQNTINNSESFDIEYRYILDGKEKIIWSKGALVEKNGKRIIRGTVMDLTEKQTLINRLQHSDMLFKQAQDLAQIGSWSLDLKTNELEWSDTLYHIYELNKGEDKIDYNIVASYNHPDDAETVSERMARSRETLKPFDFFYRIILPGERIKILHAKGEIILDKRGNPDKMHGTLQDVTQQKEAENQLRNYQEFIQKITNVTPSIITTYNIRTGVYSFVNNAVEKLLGYSAGDIISLGMPFMLSIIHPDDLDTLLEKNNKAIEQANANIPADGGEPIVEFKYRMQHKAGGYRWLHTYGTVFERDAEGLVESVLNVSVDITEQEESERQLFQKNRELQQSNSSLEEYAYVASHDLKEPLRKISTFGDRLFSSQYNNFTEDGRVYLQKIIDSSRRMQLMINDLLSVSTITGNKQFEHVSLKEILSEALQSIEHKIDEKNARINYADLPMAYVVPSQFRQLFQNLINNSLKFTRGDIQPEINISFKYLSYADVAPYNMSKARKYLQIAIEDNGIGFDNIYANKIFTIFQRLHGKQEYEGTGIGLAICKKIVENHSGIISASGIQNKGATFTITFPL